MHVVMCSDAKVLTLHGLNLHIWTSMDEQTCRICDKHSCTHTPVQPDTPPHTHTHTRTHTHAHTNTQGVVIESAVKGFPRGQVCHKCPFRPRRLCSDRLTS